MSDLIRHAEDYEKLTQKPSHSWTDRKRILEYLRVNKLFQPEVTIIHGSQLLAKNPSTLGDEVWAV